VAIGLRGTGGGGLGLGRKVVRISSRARVSGKREEGFSVLLSARICADP
jgi:hypothetical protein